MSDSMHLLLFHSPVGMLVHSWRRQNSRAEQQFGLDHALFSAQLAEAAKFDGVLLADRIVYELTGEDPPVAGYEPLTTAAALAARTTHIGFIPTVSTTFTEPYTTARMLSQLDHLSAGRIGWNVVTSTDGAQNVSTSLPTKEERYERADEFMEVAYKLWDAWEDDAVVLNRESGVWSSPQLIRHPNHKGHHFRVEEALTHRRSPQGRPVIAQAGQSKHGVSFAARHADVVFTSQDNLDTAIDFRRSVHEGTAAFGRATKPGVLPGIAPLVAKTAIEAQEQFDQIAKLVPLETGLRLLSDALLGADLTGLELDRSFPFERLIDPELAETHGHIVASRYHNIHRHIIENRPTLRELITTYSRSRAHPIVVGTATEIANRMQGWYKAGACDGFTIVPTHLPEGLENICSLLVPELQSRGVFREEYPGKTLRDTLGLRRPSVSRDYADK